ncbi:MAG: acyl carrier protein [Rhodococcus sp.]|nr:acyl carrier protein [Rhodococcus sp. (in: high G+C Gram-positive bacteria)]
MTDENLADRTRSLIVRMAPEAPAEVNDDERLIEDLGFDSIRLMELTVALERVFALPRQNPEQLVDVLKVGDVVRLVQSQSTLGSSEQGSSE